MNRRREVRVALGQVIGQFGQFGQGLGRPDAHPHRQSSLLQHPRPQGQIQGGQARGLPGLKRRMDSSM